jgi:hypothetical protein
VSTTSSRPDTHISQLSLAAQEEVEMSDSDSDDNALPLVDRHFRIRDPQLLDLVDLDVNLDDRGYTNYKYLSSTDIFESHAPKIRKLAPDISDKNLKDVIMQGLKGYQWYELFKKNGYTKFPWLPKVKQPKHEEFKI